MKLTSRVGRLEAAQGGGVIVIWRHHAETGDQAVARWRKDNPGKEPDPLKVVFVRWADPQPG